MSVDARAEIFARIRAALRSPQGTGVAAPPTIEPDSTDNTGDAMTADIGAASTAERCARFARELAAVGGEAFVLVETGDAALARAVADRVARFDYRAVAVQRDDYAFAAAGGIPAARLMQMSGASIDLLEQADCAIVAAESLIADTGSAVVRAASYEDRLLPYLPPACIIVAHASRILASLDETALAAGDDERGELVIVTGPSRTADIEKTVVLGAHGPGSLTVIIASD